MDALLSVNWIALLVLIIALLLFKVLNKLAYKINWTFVILISMVMGAVLGIVFASENNSYMTWLALIGDIYVNLITALVAPVILVSVISGLIQLNDKEKMKRIGQSLYSGFGFIGNCDCSYNCLWHGNTGWKGSASSVCRHCRSLQYNT